MDCCLRTTTNPVQSMNISQELHQPTTKDKHQKGDITCVSFVSNDASNPITQGLIMYCILANPFSFIQANLISLILTQTPLPAWPYLHVLSQTLARSASTLPSHKEDGLIFHWTHSPMLYYAVQQNKVRHGKCICRNWLI